jgi:hypothetical protein
LFIFKKQLEIIGKPLVSILLVIVTLHEDKPMLQEISDFLKQGKQEAAKVWFFIYLN